MSKIKLLAFLFVLLFQYIPAFAQDNVLVPFREKGLFGLANLKGKRVMPASYSGIEPIGKGYFMFVSGAKGREPFTGVLQGTKVVITQSAHKHFHYLEEGLIVGSEKTYVSESSNFYNLKGERLFPDNFKRSKVLRLRAGQAKGEKAKLIALLVEDYDNRVSLWVFDCQQQKLLEPVLTNVYQFNLDRSNSDGLVMACTYVDAKGESQHDIIYFDPKLQKLVKENYSNNHYKEEDNSALGAASEGSPVLVDSEGEEEKEKYAVNRSEFIPSAPQKAQRPYFQRKDDGKTIFYNQKKLTFSENETLVFAKPYDGTQQRDPLVYIKNKKFGLVFSDTFRSEPMYDSIIYLRGMGKDYQEVFYYLVGKRDKNSGAMKYGVLNDIAELIIPIEYDKLWSDLLKIDINDDNASNYFEWKSPRIYVHNRVLVFELKPGAILLAEKEGKQGLIQLNGKIVMPFMYDKIWENTFNFLKSYEVETNFMVFQLGNKYGVFYLNGNGELINQTEAIFDMIPVFAYKNYMDVKGLDIYNVGTPNLLHHHLVNANGVNYIK